MAGLTETTIREAKARAGERVELADDKVLGLRVRVGSGGSKTFMLRKRVGGKPVNLTVGRWHPTAFTLADARKKARSLTSDLETSGDALAKAKALTKASKAPTVRTMFDDYLVYIRDGKKNRAWQESERIFKKHVLPVIGDRLADTVTRGDVTRLIDGIDAPGAARGAHAQISAFYTWAMPRLDNLPANPARDAGRPPKFKARERILCDAELAALWKASDAEPFPWRAAIKLLILTGVRREEAFAADRAEFDLKGALWTIPAERAKNRNAHLLHLSGAAVEVLKSVPVIGESPKLFPASRGGEGHASGYSKAAARMRDKVAEETGLPGDWTWHDIRRTVATGMQRLGVRLEVTEAVLNHVSGTRAGIVGVYQRHDFAEEKRHALDLWAAEVARIARGQERGNVVPMRSAE
uniref:tyrosine-type recombinase/integrase n=1 Tax=Altererythrobacter segetis TaxID=1104773 RepID=UPI00140DD4FF|nr:site-specific integrase [Altererythrobacter segetis]